MRWPIEDALRRGWISPEEARRLRTESRRQRPIRTGHRRTVRDGPGQAVCPIEGRTPQEKLWRAICRRWPGRARWEYGEVVPGRRYRVDIAFPAERIAVEVDGWAHHGRHLRGFRRDRERDRLLVLHGWRIFRVAAGEVHTRLVAVLAQLEALLAQREPW